MNFQTKPNNQECIELGQDPNRFLGKVRPKSDKDMLLSLLKDNSDKKIHIINIKLLYEYLRDYYGIGLGYHLNNKDFHIFNHPDRRLQDFIDDFTDYQYSDFPYTTDEHIKFHLDYDFKNLIEFIKENF